MCVLTHECVYSHMRVCIHTRVCEITHECVYSHTDVCTHTRMCVLTHGCVYSHTRTLTFENEKHKRTIGKNGKKTQEVNTKRHFQQKFTNLVFNCFSRKTPLTHNFSPTHSLHNILKRARTFLHFWRHFKNHLLHFRIPKTQRRALSLKKQFSIFRELPKKENFSFARTYHLP